MDSYSLKEYLNDLNELMVNNINININNSKDLKELIFFFMEHNIKFYIKKQQVIIKEKENLLLEIKNIKNITINTLIIKLLKLMNSGEHIDNIKNDINDIYIILENIENIKIILENTYNKLNIIIIEKKEENINYIVAEYNNN